MKLVENFETRLVLWVNLRQRLANASCDEICSEVNTWWFKRPWCPYRLHWDDIHTWPDPWDLLEETAYCDLARGLGIVYTITMLDHPELQDCVLFEHETHNLVQVQAGKYILNYSPDSIVNTSLDTGGNKKRRSITQAQIKNRIK